MPDQLDKLVSNWPAIGKETWGDKTRRVIEFAWKVWEKDNGTKEVKVDRILKVSARRKLFL